MTTSPTRMSPHGRMIIIDGPEAAYPPFLANGIGDCATTPSALADDFTEDSTRTEGLRAQARAKAVCAGCPFKAACFEWALDTLQQGTYGATTTRERKAMRANPWRLTAYRAGLAVLDVA